MTTVNQCVHKNFIHHFL